MAITTIPWGDGSGDNIYLSAPSQTGDQSVSVTSDPNTGAARSKVVTFSASGVSPVLLTINQAAGGGGGLSDYVQSGLVLHMDGKSGKTGNTSWESVVGNHIFTNYGATFNDDNVQFDGDDYLINTSFEPPLSGNGTIEIVYDNDYFGTTAAALFAGKTASGMCFYMNASKLIFYSIGGAGRARPVATLAKASTSISVQRRYENGSPMSTSGSDYIGGRNDTNHIGRRNTGNYFKGKIYSIRIYDRYLTEDEVMQNLAVDNSRFNLGLTL